jgi:hypothetical protein
VCVTVDAHAVCSAISAPKAVNGAQQYSGGRSCWTGAVYDAFETKPGRFQAEFLITHTITHITWCTHMRLRTDDHGPCGSGINSVLAGKERCVPAPWTRAESSTLKLLTATKTCICGASLHGAPVHADAVILRTLE